MMKLKEKRNALNLSQKEVADNFNVSIRTYKRIENEKKYLNSVKYKFILENIDSVKKNIKIKVGQKRLDKKITIIGCGYVGLANGFFLSSQNEVTFFDINKEKVALINEKKILFRNKEATWFEKNNDLHYIATQSVDCLKDQDLYLICLPTDFKDDKKTLDTDLVEKTIEDISKKNSNPLVVIKSTMPLGSCDKLSDKYPNVDLIYYPEFLTEKNAFSDVLKPERIILGYKKQTPQIKSYLQNIRVLHNFSKINSVNFIESEAIKLFSNAYLALRVSFFNEIDSFAAENNVSTSKIIRGISLDSRIGNYYNTPSFGFGGSCLPKDTKSLASSNLINTNCDVLNSINKSNFSRKRYIVNTIIKEVKNRTSEKPENLTIGFYDPSLKTTTFNKTNSVIYEIKEFIEARGFKTLMVNDKNGINLKKIKQCILIISDRNDKKVAQFKEKLYTRDTLL